jgi:hypothetical protein
MEMTIANSELEMGWPHCPTAGIHAGPREATDPSDASSRSSIASGRTSPAFGASTAYALVVACGASSLHRPRRQRRRGQLGSHGWCLC